MSRRAPRQVPYTIVWRVTTTDANGNAEEEYTETRYVASNGNWHTIKQFPDGRTEEGFAEVGRGVFAISITPGEPPPDKLSHQAYPVDNGVHTQTHGDAPPTQ